MFELKSTTSDKMSDIAANIIQTAIDLNVSDIHFNLTHENKVVVKFRIDSILHSVTQLKLDIYNQLLTHIKVLANLDITQHKLPQDGMFSIKSTSCRINICPTILGPRAVIRIIRELKKISIKEMGFTDYQTKIVLNNLDKKSGLILVAGPTGSGKTVTLYHLLSHLMQYDLNILTVCDPVEVKLNNLSQTSLEHKLNLDYPTILKAFLRQDPDVIMIGEIRDEKTLKIAIQAATTGHLVLSSIHTKNALSASERLEKLGLDKASIAENVSLIIAQRLLRKLCLACKSTCNKCIAGYRGQIAIYELLDLKQDPNFVHPTLIDTANSLIDQGITNEKEVTRVLG